jgi:hypothetical protein
LTSTASSLLLLLLLLLLSLIAGYRKPAGNLISGLGDRLTGTLAGRLTGVNRPNVKSTINPQGLGSWLRLLGLTGGRLIVDSKLFDSMSDLGLPGFGLTGFNFTDSRMVGSGLVGSGLIFPLEMVRLGEKLDSELHCRLLISLLDNMRVSVELLLIKLLLSKRLLLWLLLLLLGYSSVSDMMKDFG